MTRSFGPAHPLHLDAVGPGGLRLRLLDLRITVRPLTFVTLMLIGWLVTRDLLAIPMYAAVGVMALLLHELGHALTAFAFGARPSIEIGWRGGTTRWPGANTLSRSRTLLTLAMGPVTGLAVAALAALAADRLGVPLILDAKAALAARATADAIGVGAGLTAGLTSGEGLGIALGSLVLVSLAAAAVDLLPAYPLDAGRALHTLLPGSSFQRTMRLATIGSVATFLLTLGLLATGHTLLAVAPLVYLSLNAWLAWRGDLAIGPRPTDAIARGDWQAIVHRIEVGCDGLEVAVEAQRAAMANDDLIAVTEIGRVAFARGWRFHDIATRTAVAWARLRQPSKAIEHVRIAESMGASIRTMRRNPAIEALSCEPGWPYSVDPIDPVIVEVTRPGATPAQTRTSTSSSGFLVIAGTSAPSAGQPIGSTT